MGLSDDGSAIESSDDTSALDALRVKNNLGEGCIPIAALHHILANKEETGNDFKVVFTLFFMGTLLSPTSLVYIPSKDLSRVHIAKTIRGKKWATWTFNRLCEGIQKYRNSNPQYICGCLLVLQPDEAGKAREQPNPGPTIDLTIKIPSDAQSMIDGSHKITILTQNVERMSGELSAFKKEVKDELATINVGVRNDIADLAKSVDLLNEQLL